MQAWVGMAAIAAALGAAAPAGAQCLVFEGDVPSGPPDLAGASDVAANPDGASVYAVALSGDALNVFTRDPATGAVTYFSQFNDGVSGVDGLDTPRTVTVSPDGKHVYVGSDDGVAVFRELPSSVQLQYVELHGAPEIDRAIGVAVSRDGKHVYVADSNGSRIAIYTRDATTGALDFVTYFADGQDGALLFGVQDVAVAPDGSQVYAVSGADNAFLLFGRDPATGLLDLAGQFTDGAGGVVDGLAFAYRIAVSPDGRHIYATGPADDAVAVFSHANDGSVSFQEVVKDGVNGVSLPDTGGIAMSPDGLRVVIAGVNVSMFARNPATGALLPREAKVDEAGEQDLLGGPVSAEFSADGRSLYVAAFTDSALNHFRFPDALRQVQLFYDGLDGVEGIAGATFVAASPDERHVYVAGFEDDAIAVFARDARTGTLTFVEFERNSVNGVAGLDGPQGLAVSPDGKHLYATAAFSDAVVVFARNATTGALAYVQNRRDGFGGVDGIDGAGAVLVSPDGKHVYVGGHLDAAIARFSRNATTGELTFLGALFDGEAGANGLQGAGGVQMAMDRAGRHLYAPGSDESALSVFERDAATGALGFVQELRDGVDFAPLNFAFGALLSPDENQLYVVSLLDDALVTFARDPETGALDYLEAAQNGFAGVTGLQQPRGVARSADGRHLYVTSQMSDTLVRFDHDPAFGSNAFVGALAHDCTGTLDSASGVAVAGGFVYATSYLANAVSVYVPEPDALAAAVAAVLAITLVTRRR